MYGVYRYYPPNYRGRRPLAPLGVAASGTSVAPGAGSLAYAGFAPTLDTLSSAAPGAGALTFTGFAPDLVGSVSPGAGSLTYSGFAPTLVSVSTLAPGADALVYAGFAPTITNTGSASQPGKGTLTYQGFAPTLLGLPRETELIPVVNNLEQLRKRANVILEALQLYLPGYGSALPTIGDQPDGRLFTLTTTQTLYQAQNGAWVAVDMVP